MKVKRHRAPSADFYFNSFSFAQVLKALPTEAPHTSLLAFFAFKIKVILLLPPTFPVSRPLRADSSCCLQLPQPLSPEVVTVCFRDHSFVPYHWRQAGPQPRRSSGTGAVQVHSFTTALCMHFVHRFSQLASSGFELQTMHALEKQIYLTISFQYSIKRVS